MKNKCAGMLQGHVKLWFASNTLQYWKKLDQNTMNVPMTTLTDVISFLKFDF